VLVAWKLYNVASPTEHTAKLGGLKDVLYNNYYLDELQVWLAYRTEDAAGGADTFDQGIIDGVVNGVSSVSLFGGAASGRSRPGSSRSTRCCSRWGWSR